MGNTSLVRRTSFLVPILQRFASVQRSWQFARAFPKTWSENVFVRRLSMRAKRLKTLWRTRMRYQRSQRDTLKKQFATAVGPLRTSSFDSTPLLQRHSNRPGHKLALERLDRCPAFRSQTGMLMAAVAMVTLAPQQMKMKMTCTVKSVGAFM